MAVKSCMESTPKEPPTDSLWRGRSVSEAQRRRCAVPGEVKQSCPLGWSHGGVDGKALLRARAAREGESGVGSQ